MEDIPIEMDDGAVLRAAVAFPTDLKTGARAAGCFPVVVEHTPYVRFAAPVNPNTYFTEHGYISAVVRARGSGRSQGEVQLRSPREGLDGKAIVEWAASRLDGSDGRVAIVGCSWPGGMALNDAAYVGQRSPLKAVVAACGGLESTNRQSWLLSGLPTMGFWTFADGNGARLLGDTPAAVRLFKQLASDIQNGGDAAYQGDFWRDRVPMRLAQNIADNRIPVLLWSGWNDIVDTSAMRTYVALQNAQSKRPIGAPMAADQTASPRYQLVMGGWEHGQGLDVGVMLEWIDTWLKDTDTGMQRTGTPLHLFESVTDRWINGAQYPFVPRYTNWYLTPGHLTTTPPQTDGAESLAWADPSIDGATLSFQTPPFAAGTTIAGPISATIYASSNNTNLELIARLFDVAEDGKELLVSRGAVLGSLRELDRSQSWTDERGTLTWPWPTLRRDDFLSPGEVYRFDISLAPRQWSVSRNHVIRFELTTQTPTALCPPFGVPAKNDSVPCRLTGPQRATVPGGRYAIRYGSKWPSTVNLPQLRPDAFEVVRAGVAPTPWLEGARRVALPSDGGPRFLLPLDWANAQDHR